MTEPAKNHGRDELIDVSPFLTPETAVWPGDQPLIVEWTQRVAAGHSCNLSAITLTPHLGAHADAPLHLFDGKKGVGDLNLRAFIGPATVLDLKGVRAVTARDLAGVSLGEVERLLLQTRGKTEDDSAHLTPEAAEMLASAGILLVGIDTLSIDAPEEARLPVHRRLLEAGVAILEGLDLSQVEPGRYELIALPLRLSGVEASPVRAVLRRPSRASA